MLLTVFVVPPLGGIAPAAFRLKPVLQTSLRPQPNSALRVGPGKLLAVGPKRITSKLRFTLYSSFTSRPATRVSTASKEPTRSGLLSAESAGTSFGSSAGAVSEREPKIWDHA